MDDAKRLQFCLKTLGDVNRLRIIKFIGEHERSVSQVVEETGLSQPLVSHHLRILKNANLLEAKRQGPFIRYQLKEKRLLHALGILLNIAKTVNAEDIHEPMFHCPPFWKIHFPGKRGKKTNGTDIIKI